MAKLGDVWVNGMTFSRALSRTAKRFVNKDALVFPMLNYRRSYGEFEADVEVAARALLALGVQPGEHLGIWVTNLPEWVVVQFAAAAIGAVLVNINPAYRANELDYVLGQADISTLILTDRFETSDYFEIIGQVCPEMMNSKPCEIHSAKFPRLRRVISVKEAKAPGMLNWQEFLANARSVAPRAAQDRQSRTHADDVVNIQYTSGTTGFPKGAMLTHRNLLLNTYFVGQRLNCTEIDRVCIPVPFYHCFGCVLGTLLCAIHGSAMVIPAESFDAEATLRALQDERCTILYGVPTMFIAQLQHPRFADFTLNSLRTGIMAGSPCPIELMREVISKMGARDVTIAYGLTESSPIITQTGCHDSVEHRVTTVGRVLPGLKVRIVEPGSLRPSPRGLAGELVVRGHSVMKGYYNKPEETAKAITPDGWLHSGDLAMETPDGYYRITGRLKDMIIRGGENIYPREIEEFLFAHPAIADVQVVGLPDAKNGEEVSAWIRLKLGAALTEQEVIAFCKGAIAHFKVPRYVVFVTEYPTTVTGKIQKFKLRELGIERFQLHQAAAVATA